MKYTNSWHLLGSKDVLSELSTDMYKGLSTPEVRRRRIKHGPNNVWHIRRRSAKEIAAATLFDLATLLLIVSAVSAALSGKSYEAWAIVLILIAAGIIRSVTYIRANRIFEDMAREKIPVSSVLRDGSIRIVRASEIVPGDIIFLEAGDTVPCDGRVVSGDDAVVDEKGITDNKNPVHKFNTVIRTTAKSGEVPCEFRSNMLFAGSRVISGSLRIVAVACGGKTLVSMQNGGREIVPTDSLPLVEGLRGRSKITSLIMLAAVMIITCLSMFFGSGVTLEEVFLSSMAMAVAAMSEFITAIGYIIVAITLRDASDGKTDGVAGKEYENNDSGETGDGKTSSRIILREPEKTGGLSTPEIVVFCGSQYFKSGKTELAAYRAKGVFCGNRELDAHEGGKIGKLAELLSLASAATAGNGAGLVSSGAGIQLSDTAVTVNRALDAYTRKTGCPVPREYSLMDHCSSGERRSVGLDCAIINQNGKTRFVVCGAIDAVMNSCTDIETAHGRESITRENRREIFTECASLEFGGARVIAVAKKRSVTNVLEPAVMSSGMTFVGFFALAQEPEKETNSDTRGNIEFLKKSGIIPVLLTENPEGDLYYCHRFGLFNKKTVRLRASEITEKTVDTLGTDGMIVSFADIGGVYLTNAYKNVVRLLRGSGEERRSVTAVGMNMWDAGALSEADIGVAVSRSEYRTVPEPLSKHAAVIVHPEKNRTEAGFGGLSGLVRGIKYARRAVENIDSAKMYILSAQCARLVIIAVSVFSDIPLMNAVFMLIWGLLFDFVTALVMAFENNGHADGYIRERFRKTDETEEISHPERKKTVFSMISGAIWGGCVIAVIPVMKVLAPVLGYEYSAEKGASAMAASVILSGVIFALEIMKRGSIFLSGNQNVAKFMYVTVSTVFALLLSCTGVCARFASGQPCFDGIAAVFAPMVMIFAVFEIGKMMRKMKSRGER